MQVEKLAKIEWEKQITEEYKRRDEYDEATKRKRLEKDREKMELRRRQDEAKALRRAQEDEEERVLRETEDKQERRKREAKDAAEMARREMLELNWRRLKNSQIFAEQKLQAVIMQEIQNIRNKLRTGEENDDSPRNSN